MPKYIRTKNGKVLSFYTIEVTGDVAICYTDERDKNALDGGSYFDKKDIIITDTVKELLDETIFLYKGKRYKCSINTDVWGHRFVRFEKIVHHIKKYPHTTVETVNMKVATAFKKGIVYGSIWSGLDLKAVTQMNEKGDWVLL